jgi:hypothetical protein
MVMALLCGAAGLSAQGQAAPPAGGQQPASGGQQAAQADALKFTTEAAVVIWQVKPASAADFESSWTAIKTKLSASDKPDLKELGDSVKIFKASVPAAADQPVVYVMEISPASKTLSYDPARILYTPDMWPREEADALFKKIADSIANISALPLTKVGGAMGM